MMSLHSNETLTKTRPTFFLTPALSSLLYMQAFEYAQLCEALQLRDAHNPLWSPKLLELNNYADST